MVLMKSLGTAVCAYYGTTRTAQGIVRLNWTLGPLVRSTLFYVADILETYKMLLEWPWIHANLVVASSYHISIKFPMNGWCLYLDSDPVNPSFIQVQSLLLDPVLIYDRPHPPTSLWFQQATWHTNRMQSRWRCLRKDVSSKPRFRQCAQSMQ